MDVYEGGLKFSFRDEYNVTKFDDTSFYRKYFNRLPYSKGLDFIADSSSEILMVEVKNCKGNEAQNRWRTEVNRTKSTTHDVIADDSFDIEIAQKVAMSISCLVGASTKSSLADSASTLMPFYKGITSSKITSGQKRVKVIFLLEGDFDLKTRSKAMIMQRIQESLRKKLHWLNCAVQVVDSKTVSDNCFVVGTVEE